MPRDHFARLGLSVARHPPHVVDQHFAAARGRLVADLSRPTSYLDSRRSLEALYVAYRVLRDPGRQAAYLEDIEQADPETELRRLIAASLEGGLVRQSRREFLVARGRELGISEFHVHLLIAQAMIGDEACVAAQVMPRANPPRRGSNWKDYAAVGALAVAVFVALVRWAGI